ncbi:hypothetical protein EY643_08495 [Halioglobus maricola]|uniref:Tetratricopeptide repeat protein n=1 Tax=Halioglobus maricola TaxID=2601894 RepID=A0A5P9NIN1_9GAMM|nr:hypothetical protein [Halioglobus maricola]QFU75690.1 hypothetical protein EY643_08495 [Halioglobus maricola]
MSIRYTLAATVLALFASFYVTVSVAQETGQYRSRILLDPLDELGKGSEMSVRELEQSIDSIRDPYARSSATRHLARHYVSEGNYKAAIDWYQEALRADGLSHVANREMLRELAQVYLQAEQYGAAAGALEQVLDIDLVPSATDYLLLAQARYRQGDYVAVVVALDGIEAAGLALDKPQREQALALYYRVGAFAQCEPLLQALLAASPQEAAYWHQLVSVYLQQNKRREALDQLQLAMENGVAFNRAQRSLLVDLMAVNGNPYGAAFLMEQFMASGQLERNGEHQRKAFELWFQARERDKARTALASAARLTGDTELFLYLAQLQLEDEEWVAVEQTMMTACESRLQDRYVSRANLLLGVSLLKQEREEAARQVLINATLIGGAHQQAAQWLKFMDARPATEDELRRLRGPCIGSEGKKAALREEEKGGPLEETLVAEAELQSQVQPVADEIRSVEGLILDDQILTVQRAAAQRYFFAEHDEPIAELLPRLRTLAVRQSVSLVKASGTADGPPQFLHHGDEQGLGIPLRGSAQARGRYRIYTADVFLYVAFPIDPVKDPHVQFAAAQRQLESAGHAPSGDWRLVSADAQGDTFELQLGVMAPGAQ